MATQRKQTKRTSKRGAAKSAGRRRPQKRQRQSTRGWRWLWLIPLAAVAFCGWQFWLFWQQTNAFADLSYRQPSRLYGQPAVVQQGGRLSRDDLVGQLLAAGYTRYDHPDGDLPYGSFRSGQAFVELHRRIFPSPRGNVGNDALRVTFAGDRVRAIRRGEQSPKGFWLDPPLIASFYGPDLRERRPVQISELPPHLTWAVLAAEDANFEMHAGVSLSSIVRAAWVNLWANEVRQGGSTLTQQLVKNVYLTHERTWVRKAREALLSILLELRYDKRTIFQAYLNEIYWGRSGNINLMGVGAAAWAYFGKHPAQLSLSESALLAGMIQSPTSMSPQTDSGLAAAKERRDFVLGRLAQLKWVDMAELEAAAHEELKPLRRPLLARGTPYFADAMKGEAARRFGVDVLEDAGYILHSTLQANDQRLAEQAVSAGLNELETGLEKERREKDNGTPLQAALISIDPADGGIRSYVGGRDYGQSQFDRVSHARRQAGSSFKPVVYAAAFERHKANPATLLRDEPLQNAKWQPRNSDGKYRGYVTARTALEQSLNVPTARLAFDHGLDLDHVVEMAHSLGIRSKLKAFPALMLGAMEVTPLELATVYATLANGGVYNPPHGLTAVFAPGGVAVEGEVLPPPRRVVNAEVAFLVNQVLQGVLERGTARSARQRGISDRLAGKTGTTNSRRDSWFAGYAPQRATLVWVGYDNNSKTRLSGASAALPIWADFMKAVRPTGGYSGFSVPGGVVERWIDPRTGGLAEASCSQRQVEYFLQGAVPGYSCADNDWRMRPRGRDEHPLRGWLKRMRSGVGGPT